MAAETPGTAGQVNPPTAPTTQVTGSVTAGEGKPTDAEAVLLKENMSMKKKLKAIEDAAATAEEKRLKDQGDFKALAEKAEAKAKIAEEKQKLAVVKMLAIKAGIREEGCVKLIDLEKVTFDADGEVVGAAEAIDALKVSMPFLFGGPEEKPNTTPKPNGSRATAGSPATFSDWEKMPPADRYAWAEKNPDPYAALCQAEQAKSNRAF